MTVKHLQTLQRQQLAVAVATDPSVLHKFKTGFNECAGEVSRYIGNMDSVETGVKQRLAAHLSNCVSGLQQVSPFTFPGVGAMNGTASGNTTTMPINIQQGNGAPTGNIMSSAGFNGDVNNNQNTTRIQVPSGIQLIPSRLPTGELALLVPNSTNLPFFPSSLLNGATFNTSTNDGNQMPTQRSSSSAFTSVRPVKNTDTLKMTSPPLSPASSTTSFDDHQTSESFQRPRTPSPKEVTVPFPTPPGPFHHANTFSNNSFQDQKPAQQFQITSTSYSPESKQDLSLKIEYKAVPIYQPSEKHREGNFKNFGNKSLEPLSVITAVNSKMVAKEQYEEQSNHFSRKRQYPGDAEGLLTLAKQDNEASTSKFARYSIDDVSISSSSSSSTTSSGSPDQRVYVLEGHFHHHQPSTSENNNGQPEDGNNEHMWRPW